MTETYLNKIFNIDSPLVFNWWEKYHHGILIILLGTLILLFALTLKKNSYTIRYVNYLSAMAVILLLILSPFNNINVVSNLWYSDDPLFLSFYLIGGLFIALTLINISELSFIKDNKEIEFPMLIIMGFLAAILLLGTTNLMAAFIALECLAFLSYVLVAFERTNRLSSQAGVRYLFLGAIPTGIFVLGTLELYSFLGTFNMEDIEKLFYGTEEIVNLHSSLSADMMQNTNIFFANVPDYSNIICLMEQLYNVGSHSSENFQSFQALAVNIFSNSFGSGAANSGKQIDTIALYLENNSSIELREFNQTTIDFLGQLVNNSQEFTKINDYSAGSSWLLNNLKFNNAQKWLEYSTFQFIEGNSLNTFLLQLADHSANKDILYFELKEYLAFVDKNKDLLNLSANELLNSLTLDKNISSYSDYLLESIGQFKIFQLPIILKIAILLISVNLLFKITAAPFNIWAPRVYEGAPLPSAMFLTIFSKIAIIFFMLRFFLVYFYDFLATWAPVFIICGLASMLGAIAGAISETKIKKFFVYSSMSHVGLMVLALACANIHGGKAVIMYLAVYTVTSLGGWTIITLLLNRVNKIKSKKLTYITSLKGLSKNNAMLSFFLAIIMFSMGGIPPLAGFFAKFEVLYALAETQLFSIAFTALLLSVISFFYYLRIVKVLYFDPVKKYSIQNKYSQEKAFILSIGFLFTIFFILYAQQPLIYCVRSVFKPFFQEIFN